MCVSFSRKPGFALFGWSLVVSALADHSLPFITARAMFDGDITNESFAAEKFRDPAVLTFMQKIKVAEDPALTARGGTAVPTRVTAILADGQRVSREVDHAPGFAARPMSRNEVERKGGRPRRSSRWPLFSTPCGRWRERTMSQSCWASLR